MAYSIQTIGNQFLILHDLDIFAVLAFINEAVSRAGRDYAALTKYLEQWQQDCHVYGSGTIDLKLDDLLASPTARMDLERVLASITASLNDCGATVPAEFLSCWCQARGVRFFDYPTTNVKTTVEKLTKLL